MKTPEGLLHFISELHLQLLTLGNLPVSPLNSNMSVLLLQPNIPMALELEGQDPHVQGLSLDWKFCCNPSTQGNYSLAWYSPKHTLNQRHSWPSFKYLISTNAIQFNRETITAKQATQHLRPTYVSRVSELVMAILPGYSKNLESKSWPNLTLIFRFFDMDHFKSLYWICYNIASVLGFGFWATGHVGSQLPEQGSNQHPSHWKMKS